MMRRFFKNRVFVSILSMLMVFGACSVAMATYTNDWSSAAPADHTKIKNLPAAIRRAFVDLEERLADLIYGFTAGETDADIGFKLIPMKTAGAPTAVADWGVMHVMDVSGKAELHYLDEDDNDVQVTSGGKLNAAALGSTVADITNIMELVYPVGSVVTLGVSTNPATLFGVGTWTQIEGTVVVGLSSTDAEFDTLNETGGSKTNTHTHTTTVPHGGWGSIGINTSGNLNTHDDGAQRGTFEDKTITSSAPSNTNNLQPYIVKYVWERTE